ncbi:hypothetical protein PIROE2DRAFT_62475 [Piromyces sp. E2]|nr:hypothetical protein PIROE2DRAFT_62475 [Piromyces sp. E2]|eukprot:OUM61462.1 hypothetical protein PIROE2DRAFT_62475 [Piromyces sp. E2]
MSDENLVNIETYYAGQYFPYLCSQKCKNEYERYHKCFHILDNEYYNVTYDNYCDKFEINECKVFLEDIYVTGGACSKGQGPSDYDVYDEIIMNRALYLTVCSKDKNDNYCEYSRDIQEENYFFTNLFHLSDGIEKTLSPVCSDGICRENLRHVYEILLPIYEYDAEMDPEYSFELKYIESVNKIIEYLKAEQCSSQDYYVIEKTSLYNESGAVKTTLSLLTIFLISIISTFFF